MIEAVMQSAAKGKVFRVPMPVRELLLRTNFFPCKSSKTISKLSGSNY
jgi:hypothetical protein